VTFAVTTLAEQTHVRYGRAPPSTIAVNTPKGAKALASLDQLQVAVAYLRGHLDVEGDVMAVLAMRKFFPEYSSHRLAGPLRPGPGTGQRRA